MTTRTNLGAVWLAIASIATAGCLGEAPTPEPGPAEPALDPPGDPRATSIPGFAGPLIVVSRTTAEEDASLATAIAEHLTLARVSGPIGYIDALAPLEGFLAEHPKSGWAASIYFNLAEAYYRSGYFSRAIAGYQAAWDGSKRAASGAPRRLADFAVGKLLRMHGRIGHLVELRTILDEVGVRDIAPDAEELVVSAREVVESMARDPGTAFLCGPAAVRNVLRAKVTPPEAMAFLDVERSGPRGYSLEQVGALVAKAGLPHRTIVRELGAAVPVPSVVNWKVDHYAAIVEEKQGLYRVVDPTFGDGDFWLTRDAIDEESSGFFVTARPDLVPGWRDATRDEARLVYGMGLTSLSEPGATGTGDTRLRGRSSPSAPTSPPPCSKGMCQADAHLMLASLLLEDTPIGFWPAGGGPGAFATLRYTQRDQNEYFPVQSQVGASWNLNFIAYLDSYNDQVPTHRMSGGGTGRFTSPGLRERGTDARLEATTTPNRRYTLVYPDGSKHVYAAAAWITESFSDNTGFRRFYLTQIIDPQGRGIEIKYVIKAPTSWPGEYVTVRLDKVVDDRGGTLLTFHHEDAANPSRLTRIKDRFGREAILTYVTTSGAQGAPEVTRLASITDVIGMKSAFVYGSNQLSMVTDYGTSTFKYGTGANGRRWLELTDPTNATERIEFTHDSGIAANDPDCPFGASDPRNNYLQYRNTFHWNANAYARAKAAGQTNPFPYATATVYHWLHTVENPAQTSPILESYKAPNEGRVWLTYKQATSAPNVWSDGPRSRPDKASRKLDDGTVQTSTTVYGTTNNPNDRPTGSIDAAGRELAYDLAANGQDITSVRQGGKTLAQLTYDTSHQPLTYKDASGNVTSYAYDRGQLAKVTNARGEVTRYEYYPDTHAWARQLKQVVNHRGRVALSLAYDTYGRVASATDVAGFTVNYQYDKLDRLTRQDFPGSGRSITTTYDKLEPSSVTDTRSALIRYRYDAARRLVGVTNVTAGTPEIVLAYHPNGSLASLKDAKGNLTRWGIDVQGRITTKTYADGSIVTYGYQPKSGRLRTVTSAGGRVKTIDYTIDDRVSAISYAGGTGTTSPVTYAWNSMFPTLKAMTDRFGTTTFAYSDVDPYRLVSQVSPTGTATYAYDALRRIVATSVAGSTVVQTFDDLGRPDAQTSALGTIDLDYNGDSREVAKRTFRRDALVRSTVYSYGANSWDRRLASITPDAPGRTLVYAAGTPLPSSYRVTAHAQLTSQDILLGYGPTGALDFMFRNGTQTDGYELDHAGNVTPTLTGTAATFNAVNQPTSAIAGRTLVFDRDGNTISDGVRTFEWDAENRLTAVKYVSNPNKLAIEYDGFGRRARMTETVGTAVTTRRFTYCGASICRETRSGASSSTWMYLADGEVVTTASGTARRVYLKDHLGSVRDVFDGTSGALLGAADYGGFGAVQRSWGYVPERRFAQLAWNEVGQVYLSQTRAMDPRTARWLSRDPIGELGGINLYQYAAGNPVTMVDPVGAEPGFVAGAVGIAGAAAAPGATFEAGAAVAAAATAAGAAAATVAAAVGIGVVAGVVAGKLYEDGMRKLDQPTVDGVRGLEPVLPAPPAPIPAQPRPGKKCGPGVDPGVVKMEGGAKTKPAPRVPDPDVEPEAFDDFIKDLIEGYREKDIKLGDPGRVNAPDANGWRRHR